MLPGGQRLAKARLKLGRCREREGDPGLDGFGGVARRKGRVGTGNLF